MKVCFLLLFLSIFLDVPVLESLWGESGDINLLFLSLDIIPLTLDDPLPYLIDSISISKSEEELDFILLF